VSRAAGKPEAVFDLAAAQATAVDDALVYYRRSGSPPRPVGLRSITLANLDPREA
jgi:hypothetical protein